jgi:hypothetical protein
MLRGFWSCRILLHEFVWCVLCFVPRFILPSSSPIWRLPTTMKWSLSQALWSKNKKLMNPIVSSALCPFNQAVALCHTACNCSLQRGHFALLSTNACQQAQGSAYRVPPLSYTHRWFSVYMVCFRLDSPLSNAAQCRPSTDFEFS